MRQERQAGAAADVAWNLLRHSLQKDAALHYRGNMRVKININKTPQKNVMQNTNDCSNGKKKLE